MKLGSAVLGAVMVMFAVALASPADIFAAGSDGDNDSSVIEIDTPEALTRALYDVPTTGEPVKIALNPNSYFFQKDPSEYTEYDYQSYAVDAGRNIQIDLRGASLPGQFSASSYDSNKPIHLTIENGSIVNDFEGTNLTGVSLTGNVICKMTNVSVTANRGGINFVNSNHDYPNSELALTNCRIKSNSDDYWIAGVDLMNTKFEMTGGEVSGGSGLCAADSVCTMENGTIRCTSNDEVADSVYVYNGGSFEMNGGELSGASIGLRVQYGGRFVMNAGKISGDRYGVYDLNSDFDMNGGKVTSNDCGIYCEISNVATESIHIEGNPDIHGKNCDFEVMIGPSEVAPPLTIKGKMTNPEQFKVRMIYSEIPDNGCQLTRGFAEHNPGRDPAEVFLSVGEDREDRVVAGNDSGEAAFVKGRKVSFEANGGSGTMLVQQIPLDTDTKLFGNGFTRKGYKFTGWNTKSDGSGTAYANKAAISFGESDKNLTLYAQWKLCTLSKAKVTGVSSKVYTGKKITQSPVVTLGGVKLKYSRDYAISYKNNTNAGKATMTITGKGNYTDSIKKTFMINRAANPMKIKAKTATVKYSKVKKKTKKLAVTKVIKFTNKGQGAKTYVKKSGNKKITIAKKTGKVTVKKGLKKGTYKVKVLVKANGTANYKASAWKTVTFKITVK